jgi:hypothetical protein
MVELKPLPNRSFPNRVWLSSSCLLRSFPRLVHFEPNKRFQTIAAGEPSRAFAVLPNPFYEIVGHADLSVPARLFVSMQT